MVSSGRSQLESTTIPSPETASSWSTSCCTRMSSALVCSTDPHSAAFSYTVSGEFVWMWILSTVSVDRTTMEPPSGRRATRSSVEGGNPPPRINTSVHHRKSRSRSTCVTAAAAGTTFPLSEVADATGVPSISRTMPSSRRTNPLPPASTTPACLSVERSSGVLRRAVLAPLRVRLMKSSKSRVADAASSAASAVSRQTVRMVPSIGSSSAAWRRLAPARNPAATLAGLALWRSPRASRNPSRN